MHYKTPCFPHQEEIVEKVVLEGIPFYGLFLEQGLGKTKIALDIAVNRIISGQVRRVFIACPASLVTNWKQEIRQHTDWESDIYAFNHFDFISYGLLSYGRGMPTYMDQYDLLIVDESHYLKNPLSRRTKYLLKYLSDPSQKHDNLKIRAPRNIPQILTLTGTPMTKDARDYYIQMFMLNTPGGKWPYKTWSNLYLEVEFHKTYIRTITGIKIKDEKDFFQEFVGLASFVKKKDCIKLPEKVYATCYYPLSSGQKKAYLALMREAVIAWEEIHSDQKAWEISNPDVPYVLPAEKNLFVRKTTHTFFQICSGFMVTEDIYGVKERVELVSPAKNPRLKALVELIEGLPENAQVIIYASYQYDVAIVSKHLMELGYKVAVRTGAMSAAAKEVPIEEFKSGKKRFLVATVQSSSTGLNLQGNCSHMIYYSNSAELVHMLQSEDRIHRMGQAEDCYYYYLVSQPENTWYTAAGYAWEKGIKDMEFADYKLLKRLQQKTFGVNVAFEIFKEIVTLSA